MNGKSAFFVTTFAVLVPSLLIGQNPLSLECTLSTTPSIGLQYKLDATTSTGIKLRLDGFYTEYSNLTGEQNKLALTTALYLVSNNKDAKGKVQIAKKATEDPYVSLGYSHPINKQVSIKGNLIFHINEVNVIPELKIGANYSPHNQPAGDRIRLQAQCSIKNYEFSYASLSGIYPNIPFITNDVKVAGSLILYKPENDTLSYRFALTSKNNSDLMKTPLIGIMKNSASCFVIKKIHTKFFEAQKPSLLEELKKDNLELSRDIENKDKTIKEINAIILEEYNRSKEKNLAYNLRKS